MSGLIAIPCRSEQGRFIDTYRMVLEMRKPADWDIRLFPGWFPHENRQTAADVAIEKGFDHILYLDDDQIIPPYFLEKLLAHNVDIVSCNLLMREPPFLPYLYTRVTGTGEIYPTSLEDKSGLIEVKACGLGGVLIKTEVFKKLPKPYFSIDKFLGTDDLYFCREAIKHGFKIHYDCECPSGHIVLSHVWPIRNPETGAWETTVIVGNKARVNFPTAKVQYEQ